MTDAEIEGRRQVHRVIRFLKRLVPGFAKAHLISTGSQIGIRETRRILGEYTLTGDDVLEARQFPDAIARGSYPVDIHDPSGKGWGVRFVKDGGAYGIPYRCLVPLEIENLLAHSSMTLPYTIWMMRGFFETIPMEIQEAALVDGCSRLGAMLRISLPLAVPGIVGAGLYAFETSWNEYLFARTFISRSENMVASVGISTFIGEYTVFWHQIMAAAVLSALPAFIIFFVFQRFLVQGLSSGAVKG